MEPVVVFRYISRYSLHWSTQTQRTFDLIAYRYLARLYIFIEFCIFSLKSKKRQYRFFLNKRDLFIKGLRKEILYKNFVVILKWGITFNCPLVE